MKKILILSLIFFVVLLPFGVRADYGRTMPSRIKASDAHWGFFGKPDDPNSPLAELRPTTEQKKQIFHAVMDISDSLLPIKLEDQRLRIELAELLLRPNITQADLSRKMQMILNLEAKKQQVLLSGYFKIAAVLTPIQKKAFSRLVIGMILKHGAGITMKPHGEMFLDHPSFGQNLRR